MNLFSRICSSIAALARQVAQAALLRDHGDLLGCSNAKIREQLVLVPRRHSEVNLQLEASAVARVEQIEVREGREALRVRWEGAGRAYRVVEALQDRAVPIRQLKEDVF